MPGDAQDKTLLDLAVTGGIGALVAVFFAAIRAARAHVDDTFNLKRFAVGLFSAGGVGALVAWGLDALSVSRELSAIIIAMCGYCGGSTWSRRSCPRRSARRLTACKKN